MAIDMSHLNLNLTFYKANFSSNYPKPNILHSILINESTKTKTISNIQLRIKHLVFFYLIGELLLFLIKYLNIRIEQTLIC